MRVGFWFSNVTFRPSCVFHSRVFSHPSVDTDEQSSWKLPAFLPNIQNVDKFFVLTMSVRFDFSTLYTVITVHAVEIFHCNMRCINRICKEVLYETFSISFHFHKIVHENTFALTPLCFIWVSMTIAKTRPHRSCCFLSMFKLRCKRHYRNLATYSWCTTWREHVTKTAAARRRHSVSGGAPIRYDRRRQQNVGGAQLYLWHQKHKHSIHSEAKKPPYIWTPILSL